MHNPQPIQGHSPHGKNPTPPPKGRTDGRADGWTDGQTTQNNAQTEAWTGRLTDDSTKNNSTNIIQPDTQQPHDNTTGNKRSDDKTTPGASSGLPRRVLPRRIRLHLSGKGGTTNTVLGQPSKPKVSNSTNFCERVHRRCGFQPGKTPERRQRTLQGIPQQVPIDLYDHHNRGHTKRMSVAPTAV